VRSRSVARTISPSAFAFGAVVSTIQSPPGQHNSKRFYATRQIGFFIGRLRRLAEGTRCNESDDLGRLSPDDSDGRVVQTSDLNPNC